MFTSPNDLPAKLHYETAILGSMLLDPLAVQDARAKLNAEDFSLDSHQRIYRSICEVVDSGEGADLITVAACLERNKLIEAIGGRAYLCFLTDGIPRHLNIESYVRNLLDGSMGRRACHIFQQGVQRLLDESESAAEVIDDISRQLVMERPEDTLTAAQVVPEALRRMYEGNFTIIPTGVREIDEMTLGGLRTKELWIVGAQPSGGKSALCRQIERSAVKHGYAVHAHSIEIDREKWMLQHTAYVAGIPSWKLRQPHLLNITDKDRMMGAGAKVSEWPYRIDDAGGVTIDTLLAKSRLSVMRHGTKLITVDYIQRLVTKSKQRKDDLSEAVVRLKEFAKEYDVCVIALSQLARKGDINAKPIVQDLKESGDLEAAADVIVLNYRPKDLERGIYSGEDELIIGKQRDGSVGAFPMFFDVDTLTFTSRGA